MARRIIFTQRSGIHDAGSLFIDQWVDIDWKDKLLIDEWTGDAVSQQASYQVGIFQKSFEDDRPTLLEYGTIAGPEDVAWIKQATQSTARVTRVGDMPRDLIARIHQLEVEKDDRKGFTIEVLTGDDAKAQIQRGRNEQLLENFKEMWWLIPIAIVLGWWLL